MEAWQKKAVFWRTFRHPLRLALLVGGLVLAFVFNIILSWFWPAIIVLALAALGFILTLSADLGNPININRQVYNELIGDGGLGYRFKSRLQSLERLFADFLRRTRHLDDEVIGDARREAVRASLALAERLYRVGILDRLNRESRRDGIKTEHSEVVNAALEEVENFQRQLSGLLAVAADTALLGKQEAVGRMAEETERLREWREALGKAQREMEASGF